MICPTNADKQYSEKNHLREVAITSPVELTTIYDGVLVDIDDTLYDYETAHEKALRYVYDRIQSKLDGLSYEGFAARYRDHRNFITKHHNGSGATRSRALAFQKLFEEVDAQPNYLLSVHAEDIYWDHLISQMTPNQPIVELLHSFAKNGALICALTDMQLRVQVAKIVQLELEKIIHYIVSSEEIGVEKPDARMFEAGVGKLSLKKERILVIGDHWEKDILGARNIGIDSLWVQGEVAKWVKS